MPQTPDYSIGHPIVSKYEKELIASLVQLYPDEGERLIVETVLIPHFRAKLVEVFEEYLKVRAKGQGGKKSVVPIASYETPELCSRIDKMIKKNRKLLATETLFKPAFERIQEYRSMAKEELDETSRQSFVNALAVHGITDRLTLLKKGPKWFKYKSQFPPYGRGYAFAKAILGRRITYISLEILEEMADVLGFEQPTEQDVRQEQQALLAGYGITDRQSLLKMGVNWYMSKDAKFPPFGGGKGFIRVILGRSIPLVSLEILEEVADTLGFEKPTEQDERQKQLELLAGHGITDRHSLLKKGSEWFMSKKAKFPPYGGGHAFIGAILGRGIPRVTLEVLEETADVLGFEKPTEQDERQKQLELLAGHGITDHHSLLKKGSEWFKSKEAKFPPYGGGHAFIKNILGGSFRNVNIEILEEVADALSFEKPIEQNHRQKQLELLAGYGIIDRPTLVKGRVVWFTSKEAKFPPYRSGRVFIGDILGRSIGNLTHEMLEEVADVLGFEKLTEQDERQKQLELLASYGITDRQSLVKKGVGWFRSKETKFPPYGGGLIFIGSILGRSIRYLSLEILEETADILFPASNKSR